MDGLHPKNAAYHPGTVLRPVDVNGLFAQGGCRMRVLLFVAAPIAAVWALDAVAFEGQYSQATWREAVYRGNQFNSEMRYFLRKIGLIR